MLIIELSSEKHALQNIQNDCYEGLSDSCRVHQIRFRPGLRPRPRWGAHDAPPDRYSRLGRGTPPPHSSPPRPVRRLGLVACGDSSSAPRSQNPSDSLFRRLQSIQNAAARLVTGVSFNNASAITAPILCIGVWRGAPRRSAIIHNIEAVISFFLIEYFTIFYISQLFR